MNLIILTSNDIISQDLYKLTDERFIHIKNILKAQLNDLIEIGLLNNSVGKAKIEKISDDEIILKIVSHKKRNDYTPHLDLILALPRPQTLKKVLAASATMGINNLFLIRSEKVEKSYFHSPLLIEDNYKKYLIEGLSQGKRIILPKVTIHHYFKKFFDNDFSVYNHKLLAHPSSAINLKNINIKQNDKLLLAIGPEGGWNEFEINYLIKKGFIEFKISNNILRVEQAVTAAISQIELLLL